MLRIYIQGVKTKLVANERIIFASLTIKMHDFAQTSYWRKPTSD